MRTPPAPTWQADSAVRSETWPRPGKWLTGSDRSLVWDYPGWMHAGSPTTGANPGMLGDFIALADAPNARIVAYARQWGMLDLCQHHLPSWPGVRMSSHPWQILPAYTHPWHSLPAYMAGPGVGLTNADSWPSLPDDDPFMTGAAHHPSLPTYMALTGGRGFIVQGGCENPDKRESYVDWRYWSGQAHSLASVGLAVAKDSNVDQTALARLFDRAPWVPDAPGEYGDGRPIFFPYGGETLRLVEEERLERLEGALRRPGDPVPSHKAAPLTQADLRTIVEDALDFWLTMSRVSFRLHWVRNQARGHRPEGFFTGGLFAALGIALLMAIEGRQGFAICSGCGMPHIPARPNDTRASYCPNCRGTVPRRLAAQRYGASDKGRRARAERLARRRAEASS